MQNLDADFAHLSNKKFLTALVALIRIPLCSVTCHLPLDEDQARGKIVQNELVVQNFEKINREWFTIFDCWFEKSGNIWPLVSNL